MNPANQTNQSEEMKISCQVNKVVEEAFHEITGKKPEGDLEKELRGIRDKKDLIQAIADRSTELLRVPYISEELETIQDLYRELQHCVDEYL